MKTIEQLTRLVGSLKNHVDCLLIRVSSCEQFIERLFQIIGQSYTHERCSSVYQYGCTTSPSSPDRDQTKKRNKKQLQQIAQLYTNAQSQAQKKSSSPKMPSINDFVIFPSSKQAKQKQAQNGSFMILKNLIMVHNHEIQKLQQKYQQLIVENQNKYAKSGSAIQLLTKVLGLIQEKVQILWEVNCVRKKVRSKSSVKNKSNLDNYLSF